MHASVQLRIVLQILYNLEGDGSPGDANPTAPLPYPVTA